MSVLPPPHMEFTIEIGDLLLCSRAEQQVGRFTRQITFQGGNVMLAARPALDPAHWRVEDASDIPVKHPRLAVAPLLYTPALRVWRVLPPDLERRDLEQFCLDLNPEYERRDPRRTA